MKNTSRNLGIDILRIVSMIGVVFLHILGHGGLLDSQLSPAKFSMVWFLELLAYPAVNCFILISGYVGYKGERIFPKIKNMLYLMFTVVFYSVLLFFIFKIFMPDAFGLKELAKSFMPTILNRYWFFSAYFGLFLLSPLLNLLVYKSNFKHIFVFLTVFSLFIIISTVNDTFLLLEGYSVIWFAFMYLIGAAFKRYNINKLFSKKWWLIIAVTAFAVTYLSKITLHFIDIPFLKSKSDILVTYISPTLVIMALGIFNWFSKIKCSPSLTPIISFFSSSAFSVYLIHDNIYVREYLISKIHNVIGGFNFVLLTLSIICIVGVIFFVCILIDKIRIVIFKVIQIDKLLEQIEKFIKTVFNAVYIRFEKTLNSTAE